MKTTIRKAAQIGFVSAIALCATIAVNAQTIGYDNTTTSLGSFHSEANGTWFGDEITLASPGNITGFSFETFGSADMTDGMVTLQILANDGAGAQASPGTLLYDSGAFAVGTGIQSHEISGLNVDASGSASITWAVNFSSTTGSGSLVLYDPPTVGSSFNDFWVNDGGGWTGAQFTGGSPVANFGAQVVVPEPTTIALGVIGGLALVGQAYRRRNRA